MLVEEKYALAGRVKETIYTTLNQHHIEIPFPQRDLHIIQ
jgi:small-conductance mechanosensitive channel